MGGAQRRPGILEDPRWLAAGAGGLLAAVAALWAFRALPLGTVSFWLTPFPLFAAGLSAGPGALAGGVALAALLVWLLGGGLQVLVFLGAFGVPVLLLVTLGLRGGRIDPSLPLAVLGIWPAIVVLLAAFALADTEGGLEGALRAATEMGLRRMGLPEAEELAAELVRVKAAAVAFWLALALLANGAAAQGWLVRRDLALCPSPAWSEVRLPGWYPLLPALAFGVWVASPSGADTVQLSVLLVLLLPVFLQGVAGVHRRSRGRTGRGLMLAFFYLGLLILSVPAAAAVTVFGFYEQWGRRTASSGGNT